MFYCFHFYSSQIYLIFCNRCNASSSSSCNDRPVSNSWSSRSLFLLVLSDDFLLFIGRHLQTKTSYYNSNCTHNSTDHKPQAQVGLSTVKLCLMSAVFHKVYNDQLHQFEPEVLCSEIVWLVTLRRRNFTCCESISSLEAYDWHCHVILTALYLIHAIWYDKICTVVRLNENWKITSFVYHYMFSHHEGVKSYLFNATFWECATFLWSKCVTTVWIS